MDNVLTDFSAALKMRNQETREQNKGREDEIPGLFAQMPPISLKTMGLNAPNSIEKCTLLVFNNLHLLCGAGGV